MNDHDLIVVGPFTVKEGRTYRGLPRGTELYVAQCSGTPEEDCLFQTEPGTLEQVSREHTQHVLKRKKRA